MDYFKYFYLFSQTYKTTTSTKVSVAVMGFTLKVILKYVFANSSVQIVVAIKCFPECSLNDSGFMVFAILVKSVK